jgi:uncharacterized MAPEG superfamily protein
MQWVELVTLLALIELFFFSLLVARARGRYDVKAPATTGHEVFERYFRVHQNTIELLILLLPSMWIAFRVWGSYFAAGFGLVYLIGRLIYLRAYVSDPKSRSLGFVLSIFPILILMFGALIGVIRNMVRVGGL